MIFGTCIQGDNVMVYRETEILPFHDCSLYLFFFSTHSVPVGEFS